MNLFSNLIAVAEQGWFPDWLLRRGIRSLLQKRLTELQADDPANRTAALTRWMQESSTGPIAPIPDVANQQHYEVPASVFQYMLGPRLKYSCCYWDQNTNTLSDAEQQALILTCQHAELADGMEILELGCGWGSLTLWIAEQFPNSRITAVSNSHSQRKFIQELAAQRGLSDRVEVITADINTFDPARRYDRVVSVEMFEHLRNYQLLLQRIGSWLHPDGKLFVHIFCHRRYFYEFADRSSSDWMSRHFFSGGIMPSEDLLPQFQQSMLLQQHWQWNGMHYQRTADAWLANMDRNRAALLHELQRHYGRHQGSIWLHRWRMFYLACSELFGYDGGEQWYVSHYLFAVQQGG